MTSKSLPFSGGSCTPAASPLSPCDPELAARFFNLEAIDASDNLAKSAKVTAREVALARQWHREGLLSTAGLETVEAAVK